MTTTLTAPHAVASPAGRIWNVARLNVTNPMTTLILPWIIIGSILLMNIAIWALVSYAAGGDLVDDPFQYNGAIAFIYVYLGIVAIQAMSITFPFALGYGVTRRDFYLGSAVTFVLLAVIYATGMTLLGAVERLTGGWGLNGRMFTAVYFAGDEPWYVQFWLFLCGLLFALFLGSVFAAVWVRWKTFGLVATFIILGFAAVGVLALLTLGQLWDGVWTALSQLGWVGASSASLVITALLALLGFALLRRATPRA
jgi:hypothetical protein